MNIAITAVVAGLIGLAPMGALAAQPEDPELHDHEVLISVIEKLGIPFTYDGEVCKQNPRWYGGYELKGRELTLCNKGDRAEKLNTLRHEAWHLYADLKDCNIKDTAISAAFSGQATPRTYKDLAAKHYAPGDVAHEAEAFWAADTFGASVIANLIYQQATECGFKF